MQTPTHLQQYERQLGQEVQNCFPNSRTQVAYWGVREGLGDVWRVTVDGIVRDLNREQAELATGFRRDAFRALF
jgi:hypothetical protein